MIGKQNAQSDGKRGNTAGRKILGLTRQPQHLRKNHTGGYRASMVFAKFCVLT